MRLRIAFHFFAAAMTFTGACISHSTLASEIRVGVTADIATLDPQNYRDRITQSIIGNLYDGFFLRLGEIPQPAVIKEWIQIDPTTYEAVLRDGVKFHSGAQLTVEDVKFTFDRLTGDGRIAGKTSPRKSFAGPLESVEIVDKSRVRLKLSSPYPTLPGALSTEAILNKSFVETVGDSGLSTKVDGAGPFKLVEWNRGDKLVMERFADYYGGSAVPGPVGPARVDRVTFRVIPETSSRVAALLAGEIDIATEIPPFLSDQITQSKNATVQSVNGTRTFFVALNNTQPPFDNLKVRQAANHAIDRNLIIDRVLNGTATPVNGVLSPESFASSDNLPEHKFDPALAKKLLAEAGHPKGIDVVLDAQGANKDIAEVLATMLTEVGIRTKVQVWEGAVISPLWSDANKKNRDMYLNTWGSAGLDPNGIFYPTLRTGERGNQAGYSNPEVDRLLDAGRYEADSTKRASLFRQAEAKVNADAPWIFLWVPQDIYGVSKALKDWSPLPSQMIYLHRARVGK